MNFCIVVLLQLNASWHMFVVSVYNAVAYSLTNFTHALPICTILGIFDIKSSLLVLNYSTQYLTFVKIYYIFFKINDYFKGMR